MEKNQDQPAYPITGSCDDDRPGIIIPLEYGLSKRELIAAMFTAAFIQCPQNGNPLMIEENAKNGIAQADELLKQIEQ